MFPFLWHLQVWPPPSVKDSQQQPFLDQSWKPTPDRGAPHAGLLTVVLPMVDSLPWCSPCWTPDPESPHAEILTLGLPH